MKFDTGQSLDQPTKPVLANSPVSSIQSGGGNGRSARREWANNSHVLETKA